MRNKPIFGLSTQTKPINIPNGQKYYEMDTGNKFMFDGSHNEWLPQEHFVRAEYYGLSTAEKPINVTNGTSYYEMDTEKKYRFDGSHNTWILQDYDSGDDEDGGGLPSYTKADNGKTLMISETAPTETVTIVQEQSITFDENNSVFLPAGTTDPYALIIGEKIEFSIDGESYTTSSILSDGGALFAEVNNGEYSYAFGYDILNDIFVFANADYESSHEGETHVISAVVNQEVRDIVVQGQRLVMQESPSSVSESYLTFSYLDDETYDFTKLSEDDIVYFLIDGYLSERKIVDYGYNFEAVCTNDNDPTMDIGLFSIVAGLDPKPCITDNFVDEGTTHAGFAHTICMWKTPVKEIKPAWINKSDTIHVNAIYHTVESPGISYYELDKTWQEIFDAYTNGNGVNIIAHSKSGFNESWHTALIQAFQKGIENGAQYYRITVATPSFVDSMFECESPYDYPIGYEQTDA